MPRNLLGPGAGSFSEVGVELGYAEITANQGSITAETDIAGLAFTVTFRDRPVMLIAHFPLLTNNTVDRQNQVKIYDITSGGNTHLTLASAFSAVANQGASATARKRIAAQIPGVQKTYEVRAVPPDGGTMTVFASGIFPAFFQAVQV